MFVLKNAAYLRLSGESLAVLSFLSEGIGAMIRPSEGLSSLDCEREPIAIVL